MIPAVTTRSLLDRLLSELIAGDGEPDYNRYRIQILLDKRYQAFLDILHNGEDDLSIIVSLMEKDPDCATFDTITRLRALVDYVQITRAIYQNGGSARICATLH